MKFSNETLSVLKNFADINSGFFFRKGNKQRTISKMKTILAEAIIAEDIESDIALYELNQLLSVMSLHKDNPDFIIKGNDINIVGNSGRSVTKIRACDKNMIILPPEKNVECAFDVNLSLSAEDFSWMMKASSVLSAPNISIESDGKKVFMNALDLQNDAANIESLEIDSGNGKSFKYVYKVENLKLISGAYDIGLSTSGITNFKNKSVNIQYWIAIESGQYNDE